MLNLANTGHIPGIGTIVQKPHQSVALNKPYRRSLSSRHEMLKSSCGRDEHGWIVFLAVSGGSRVSAYSVMTQGPSV